MIPGKQLFSTGPGTGRSQSRPPRQPKGHQESVPLVADGAQAPSQAAWRGATVSDLAGSLLSDAHPGFRTERDREDTDHPRFGSSASTID